MLVPGGARVRALIGGSLHRIDEQAAVRNPLSHVRGQPYSVCSQQRDRSTILPGPSRSIEIPNEFKPTRLRISRRFSLDAIFRQKISRAHVGKIERRINTSPFSQTIDSMG